MLDDVHPWVESIHFLLRIEDMDAKQGGTQGEPSPKGTTNGMDGWNLALIIAGIGLLLYLMAYYGQQQLTVEVPYTTFKSLLAQGKVAEVTMAGDRIDITLKQGTPLPGNQPGGLIRTRIPSIGDPTLLPSLEAKQVQIDVTPPEGEPLWHVLLTALLPWVLLIGVMAWMTRRNPWLRQMQGSMGELDKFLSTTNREANIPEITFADVAGQANIKREVMELVEYLKDPERFHRIGAEMPRGVLLMGPPGTGKTLLARALAGEAHVPFYAISASEFIEVFVGVGAARVRRLFETAKQHAPSIIFIDELDAIGRSRGTGLGGGHDEREQTLNQILSEMDGFNGREAVVVLAATNRPDVLDPALLRPGRFDRHVTLDLPTLEERVAILKIHTRKVALAADVNLQVLAMACPGMSGAQLKNLVNEAALLAAREQSSTVTMTHLHTALDKILMGTERSLAIQPGERHRLAVHESGHTAVAHYLPNADPPNKVTIIPRGRALGNTQQLPSSERYTLPEDYLRDRLAVMLGGRAAEQEFLGNVSSGADDDIRQATALARAMVSRWGMSSIGPIDLRDCEEHPFLGREIAQPRHYSEHAARMVDQAVRDLLLQAEERAGQTLRAHRPCIERLIVALEKQETLDANEIQSCLQAEPARASV